MQLRMAFTYGVLDLAVPGGPVQADNLAHRYGASAFIMPLVTAFASERFRPAANVDFYRQIVHE
jgi:hypothetical protein